MRAPGRLNLACGGVRASRRLGRLRRLRRLPTPLLPTPTLSELFATHPRDGGWAGFLLAQLDLSKPLLWVQDRMAILESGRIHPPGLPSQDLIHVEARDARDALWAMEEGVRCAALSCVIGELWGDPARARFHRDRRLAVASERSGVPCWLVRLGGNANLSGARMRWRIAIRAVARSIRSTGERRDCRRGTPSCSGREECRQAAGASLMRRIASIWLPAWRSNMGEGQRLTA